MKIRTALFAIVCAAAAYSPAQTFNPARKYMAGATDAYTMKMTMKSSMGDLAINMDMVQTIQKVYDNGDADIETAVQGLTVNMAGNEMHPPAGKPTIAKVNKYGLVLSSSQSRGPNFSRYGSYFGEKELKVGETYTFEQTDKDNPKNHAKGTAKLVGVENGKATLNVSVDSYTGASEKPMHLDGTVVADAANGKMLRFEGKTTDMPGLGAPGMTVASAQFTIEHK